MYTYMVRSYATAQMQHGTHKQTLKKLPKYFRLAITGPFIIVSEPFN